MNGYIKNLFRNRNLFFLIVILYVAVYLLVGFFVFQDYNVSADEPSQREHSRVVYKYINEKLLNREIESMANVQELPEYAFKYYGVAMQMPLVFVEDFFHFDLSVRRIFQGRHLYNFLICVLGYICFYFALKKIMGNRWYALAGMVLISLYPRFYAYQFYDIKNILFAALNMVTLLTLVNVVEKCNFLNILLFASAAALTTNQRIMGVIFPAILIGYFIATDITQVRIFHKEFAGEAQHSALGWKKYPLIIFIYLLAWFVITPAAWEEPVWTFYETFVGFSNYERWSGTMMFNGRLVTCEERPWYYLFVWFGISIPVWYLVLFAAGHVYAVVSVWKSEHKWIDILGKYKWLTCSLALFWGSVGAVIILNSRIYEEWRHMFFVFVPFCCIAVYGFVFLLQKLNRKVIYGIAAVCLVLQVVWIAANHPYQAVYFNAIGRNLATKFDRDTWYASNLEMLKWIVDNDDGGQLTVQGYFTETAELVMDDEDIRRILPTADDAKYIVANYTRVVGNTLEYEGYEEVYSVWVDKYKIGSVFRKQER